MKLLIVGHSYVRELRRQGSWHLNLKLKLAQGEVNPDTIVIILGGNSNLTEVEWRLNRLQN